MRLNLNKMKIVQYCQHVLGIGHFFRSLEITRALARHEVIFVTGGPQVNIHWPDHVKVVRLPGLQMDRDFSALHTTEAGQSIDPIKHTRRRILKHLFKTEAPDLFLVELFPFGRKAFRFELDPILEGLESGTLPPCGVVCSLRDILVEKKDQTSYEARVIQSLKRHFDALLIHADPQLVKLEETFNRMGDIDIPVVYTGFVTAKPPPRARRDVRRRLKIDSDEYLVVASAGGGKVGRRLLTAVVAAVSQVPTTPPPYLEVFTGPYMTGETFERLQSLSGPRMHIRRFTDDFLAYLAAADLSISLAGYNTAMNIMATRVPALVWPFDQNREQRLRAEKLARLGMIEVLADEDLQPDRLAAIMFRRLTQKGGHALPIDLEGARNTAKWLETNYT